MATIAFRKVGTSRRWWGGSQNHYEVVLDDDDGQAMTLAQLGSLVDSRRYPADFWACVDAADRAYERQDPRMLLWPTGEPL